MTEFQMENLVVLMYATNECYTNVINAKDANIKRLKINPEKGTWSFDEWENVPIGNMRSLYSRRHLFEVRYGVIGIYDRMNTEHLDSMVRDSKKATEDRNQPID